MKRIKAFFNNIRDWFRLVKSVRELEEDVENLEDRLLAPEKPIHASGLWSTFNDLYYVSSPRKKMTLEEKVDAMATALGVNFEWTEEKDSVAVAKVKRKKK